MNHPEREEWVPYVYGETKGEDRRRLKAHLRDCPECRAEIEGWQRSLHRLAAWKVPPPPRPRERFALRLSWAGAAAILLMLGLSFGLGRFTFPAPEAARLRAAMAPAMRQEFARMLHEEIQRAQAATLAASLEKTKGLLADYHHLQETQRVQDNRDIYAVLERLDASCASIRKDLDTVALNTDVSFRATEQQLVELVADAHSTRNTQH